MTCDSKINLFVFGPHIDHGAYMSAEGGRGVCHLTMTSYPCLYHVQFIAINI